jgi:periplasmic protein TonB
MSGAVAFWPLGGVVDYAEEGFSSRRMVGIVFVVVLHVVIIYALVSGLGDQVVQILHQPLEAKIIQEVKPPPPAPPPPPQLVQPPPPFIPPPLVQIAQPPPVPVIASVTRVQPAAPPPTPVPQVVRGAGLDPNQSCAQPEYPEEAQDMGESGRTILQFLISSDGSVLNARIASSSGHSLLDETAERALSDCKFRPAIGADGKPQEAWASIAYDWIPSN